MHVHQLVTQSQLHDPVAAPSGAREWLVGRHHHHRALAATAVPAAGSFPAADRGRFIIARQSAREE